MTKPLPLISLTARVSAAVLLAALAAPSARAEVVTYNAPEDETLSEDYLVTANGKSVDVYTARTLDAPFAGKQWDHGGDYAFTSFDTSGPVEVKITSPRSLKNVIVRPTRKGIRPTFVDDHTIVLSLDGPAKLSVEPDGRKGPLLLFADPLQKDIPARDDPDVVYFGPGTHKPDVIRLASGQTLYLAGGSVVKGAVEVRGDHITIRGRGILDGSDWPWTKGPRGAMVGIQGSHVTVRGITIRGSWGWTIVPRGSRHVTVEGVKLCNGRVQNDDGINPCNTQDMVIRDCFIRSDDDCVALKGLDFRAENSNVERIRVLDSTLWCDRARIFLMGHESRAAYMRDIVVRNVDIVHFTMTPFLLEPGEDMRLENVLFEDVRLHGEGQRPFVVARPVVNQYMRKKVPGHIRDIRFRNVEIHGSKAGEYRVVISGADKEHRTTNVTFAKTRRLGAPLRRESPHVSIGPHTGEISFSDSVETADLILHGGRIVTVDPGFSVQQAVAVKAGRLLRVGSDKDVLEHRGPKTEVIELGGKMVLPGLIDSHTHPTGAAMYEFDHAIPSMSSVKDVLEYVRARAAALPAGEWIVMQQVFITRLEERRYPTREELDRAAPKHPVIFRTGPDASLNSKALEELEITRDRKAPEGSRIERHSASGEPTGILRGWSKMISVPVTGRAPTEEDRYRRVLQLFHDYSASGLTAIGDRSANAAAVDRYQQMLTRDDLPLRVAASWRVRTDADTGEIQRRIREVAQHDLIRGTPMLRIVGVKVFLDGGMLTGSAYMRKPWGVSKIYSIDDPEYRGLRFIDQDALVAMVRTTVESGLQFTAHSVGDGAVHALLDAYGTVNETLPVRSTRPCITHSNFMSREAIERMVELGVVADLQPAWLYLDTGTLTLQFGYERMRYFQPLATMFELGALAGGGSDHMQKIGSLRSINPYNPFLGMSTAITRTARGYQGRLHPEEALSREQAIRLYTINNARLLFLEEHVGSLERGKLADMIVIDRDLLSCPIEELKGTRVLSTYLAGRLVHEAR